VKAKEARRGEVFRISGILFFIDFKFADRGIPVSGLGSARAGPACHKKFPQRGPSMTARAQRLRKLGPRGGPLRTLTGVQFEILWPCLSPNKITWSCPKKAKKGEKKKKPEDRREKKKVKSEPS